MTEEANSILKEIMERALTGVDAAVEFSQQQLPDIIHQLLMWHFVKAGVEVVIGILMVVGLVMAYKKWGKKVKVNPDDEDWRCNCEPNLIYDGHGDIGQQVIFVMPTIIVIAIISLTNLWSIFTMLQIWLAPKLYLLEYGAGLVK